MVCPAPGRATGSPGRSRHARATPARSVHRRRAWFGGSTRPGPAGWPGPVRVGAAGAVKPISSAVARQRPRCSSTRRATARTRGPSSTTTVASAAQSPIRRTAHPADPRPGGRRRDHGLLDQAGAQGEPVVHVGGDPAGQLGERAHAAQSLHGGLDDRAAQAGRVRQGLTGGSGGIAPGVRGPGGHPPPRERLRGAQHGRASVRGGVRAQRDRRGLDPGTRRTRGRPSPGRSEVVSAPGTGRGVGPPATDSAGRSRTGGSVPAASGAPDACGSPKGSGAGDVALIGRRRRPRRRSAPRAADRAG